MFVASQVANDACLAALRRSGCLPAFRSLLQTQQKNEAVVAAGSVFLATLASQSGSTHSLFPRGLLRGSGGAGLPRACARAAERRVAGGDGGAAHGNAVEDGTAAGGATAAGGGTRRAAAQSADVPTARWHPAERARRAVQRVTER